MKTMSLAIVAAIYVLMSAAACGSDRVPDKTASFIAQCSWTLEDYAKKAEALSLRADTMQSPFREDAQYKVYLVIDKAEEGKAKIEELKTATGDRRNELIAEITAIMKEIGRLYDEAAAAVGGT